MITAEFTVIIAGGLIIAMFTVLAVIVLLYVDR